MFICYHWFPVVIDEDLTFISLDLTPLQRRRECILQQEK